MMNGIVKPIPSSRILMSSSMRPPADGQEVKPRTLRDSDCDQQHYQEFRKNMSRYDHERASTPLLLSGNMNRNDNCKRNPGDSHLHGSADCSPPNEQNMLPYIRWAQNLHHLLEDIEGVELFQQYLKQEGHDCRSLDFWFACEGFKKVEPKTEDFIHRRIKVIYKKSVRSLSEISAETKADIKSKMQTKVGLDETIFDAAQREVETVITKTTYPNFLRSDLYIQRVQSMQKSTACYSPNNEALGSMQESGCSTSREGLDVLPIVHEDVELHIVTSGRIPHTRRTVSQRSRFSDMMAKPKPEAQAGHYLKMPNRGYSSCYTKYSSFLPTSAQDSELQSLSSDAQTDDTMSLTDSSSVDCGQCTSRSYQKRHQKAAKNNALLNRDGDLAHNTFIPRTQRFPPESAKDGSLRPEEFAAQLTAKLQDYLNELQIKEKMNESLQKLEDPKYSSKICDDSQPYSRHFPQGSCKPNTVPVFNPAGKSVTNSDTAQSILDQHVSRVWQDSAHQTPSRSPGHLTPPVAQANFDGLDRQRIAPCGSGNGQYSINSNASCGVQQNPHKTGRSTPYTVSVHHETSQHRKDRDAGYLSRSDSGLVHDFIPDNETPQSFANHRPHHLQGNPSIDHYSMPSSDGNQGRKYRELPKRSGSKKLSTTDSRSSGVDSGVSVAEDPAMLSEAARERICNWLDVQNISPSYGPDSERDSSTCHKKSSHASTSPILGKSSKRPVTYNSSRPGTLESGSTPWPLPPSTAFQPTVGSLGSYGRGSFGVQPAQPFVQDPAMPLLPPPNTDTQLMEAKRRLEEETKSRQLKSKLTVGKEKVCHEMAKLKSIFKPVEFQDNGTLHRKSSRKSGPVPIQTTNTTPAPTKEVTVIGYCFGSKSVPYLTKLPGKNVNLKQFKSLISKKGNFKYFFKKASNDFGTGVVFEEITDDSEVLPLWEGKIFSVIESIE